ncbi:WD_REPEATS_REGION domain-containing protein, partial [Mortierella sp. GBA43]
MFYNEARAALSRMEQPSKETLLSSDSSQDQSLREEITYVLNELDKMMATLRQQNMIEGTNEGTSDLRDPQADDDPHSSQSGTVANSAAIPRHIFAVNRHPPVSTFKLPECGERITGIPQLAHCLKLLQAWRSSPNDILDPTSRNWLTAIDKNTVEIDRIMAIATDVITIFTREGIKDIEFTEAAMFLSPVVEKPVYRHLLKLLCDQIERLTALDYRHLDCLAQLIRGTSAGYLETADLLKMFKLIVDRRADAHQTYLGMSVAEVVDAITDSCAEGLDHEGLSQSISVFLDGLKATSDPQLVYQAAYIWQALQHIPDDKPIWYTAQQQLQKANGLKGNAKAVDVKEILQQLQDFDKGSGCESKEGSQGVSGESLLDYLNDGGSFECKQSWYPVLRTANALLRSGQFTEFKKLAYEAPCRRNPAFQCGLCELLFGCLAANLGWDTYIRMGAVEFLEDIFWNDAVWGQQADIKEMIISFLTMLSSLQEGVKRAVDTVLQQLKSGSNPTDQHGNRTLLRTGLKPYLADADFPSPAALSLLDSVQDTLGVEVKLHKLRKQHLIAQQDGVYVDPRATATLSPYDHPRFSLMDSVKEFLTSDRMVFLLLGDSGSGKSMFCRTLERYLWSTYERMESPIPLHVDLSTIAQPNKDLISSCLRRLGFMDDQIQGLKTYRKFILICDEYDQLLRFENLYTSNKLNQPGGWYAKMVVCCRTEHPGTTSLDYFYPTDQDCQVQVELFQQAVMEPFSADEVQDYIKQYVPLHQLHWETEDYLRVFEQDHCLKDLSTNPLLLSLSLEVLPRMVDSQHTLSSKRFNKVAIYDQITVHWYERSKSRLENASNGDVLERMAHADYIQRGVDYLKRLSAAIYKNQGGVPVV